MDPEPVNPEFVNVVRWIEINGSRGQRLFEPAALADAGESPGLAIVLRPRGHDGLRDELREIKECGLDTLVSLLEPSEARWLGLAEEGKLAEEVGMRFISYPILDVHVPDNESTFRALVMDLAQRLRTGERIGVHCQGCIGRSTVTAACILIHLGWKPKDAIGAIQAARGCAVPDTAEQRRWILRYQAEP